MSEAKKKILVTGAAGFIGYHTAERLLADGHVVVGLDNLNDYYDVRLKETRLERLLANQGFRFVRLDVAHKEPMERLFAEEGFERVVHLAAQAGVRYSVEHPHAYIEANVLGHLNILEGCRHQGVEHLVYASSSSVYGGNEQLPFSVSHSVDHPVSLYAATKKADELMSHAYSHLYGIPTTGLRFFTVYGPWGRPDMALFLFTDAILSGRPIKVFNFGDMRRDFTYIDDIVEGVVRTLAAVPGPDPAFDPRRPTPASSRAPWRVYNIGSDQPVELMHMIELVECELGRKADKHLMPMQPGDVPASHADVDALFEAVGYRPTTPIDEGIRRFVTWYREYHGV